MLRPAPARNHPGDIQELYGNLDDFWLDEIRLTLKALKFQKKSPDLQALLPLIHTGSWAGNPSGEDTQV